MTGLPSQPNTETNIETETQEAIPAPPDPPAGWEVLIDEVIGQAGQRPLTAYAYVPTDTSVKRPAVVLMHGGGWLFGHPLAQINVARYLSGLGFVTLSGSYRMCGEAKWPAALEDAKCAVRYLRANADRFGVDAENIGATGDSAGGHLSLLLALTSGRFEGTGGHPDFSSAVNAVMTFNPATDLSWIMAGAPELITGLLGSDSPALIAEASPVTYASSDAAPIYSITGAQDTLTPAEMVSAFHNRLDDLGAPNTLEVLEGREHSFWHEPRDFDDCMRKLGAFFSANLGEPPPA